MKTKQGGKVAMGLNESKGKVGTEVACIGSCGLV